MTDVDLFDDLKPQPPFSPAPPLLMSLERRVFEPGRTYVFTAKTIKKFGSVSTFHTNKIRRLVFMRDENGAGSVVHHIFKQKGAWYLETFTDAQCLEYDIEAAS